MISLPGNAERYAPQYTAIHCGYHKCLTVYFSNVLHAAAKKAGTEFWSSTDGLPDRVDDACYILSHDSRIDLERFEPCRCTHVIRDPRDLVVSGYFYHLRTDEIWCARPNPAHEDLPADVSYQQHLRSLSLEDGLCYETAHVSGRMIEYMAGWDYDRGNVLELAYEEIVGHERATFERIFRWFGVDEAYAARLARIADGYSLASIRRKKGSADGHVREGSHIGQWRRYFTPGVKSFFKKRYGEVLIDLGYESDMNW